MRPGRSYRSFPYMLVLIIVLLAIAEQSNAQSKRASIIGEITDAATGDTLAQASVSLLRAADGKQIRQTSNGNDGFSFQHIQPDQYVLVTSFIGHKNDTTMVLIAKHDTSQHSVPIRLKLLANELMEVVIRSEIPPVMVRHDTVSYNANAYKTQPNATVEDLLKKLPGVEVDKDGNITMQGKKVEKIYLDGKEFFLNDPRLASQTLTADMIDQVQAFDLQSDKAKFNGIRERGGNKAINLKLKKNRKRGIFGKANMAFGTPGQVQVGANALLLAGDNWGAANINETNNQPGNGTSQKARNGNFNYRLEWNKKLTTTLEYTDAESHDQSQSSSVRQTFSGDSTLTENSASAAHYQGRQQRFNANLELKTDTNNTITYNPSFSRDNQNSYSQDTVSTYTTLPGAHYLSSTGNVVNSSSSTNIHLNNQLSIGHRFAKKRRTLYISLSANDQAQQQSGKLYSSLQSLDSAGHPVNKHVTDQQYMQHTTAQIYGVNVTYTEPIAASQVIDMEYGLNQNNGDSNKKSFDYNPATGKYDVPDILTTNDFRNKNRQQRFVLSYNQEGKKISYQLGLAAQLVDLSSLNSTNNENIAQQQLNWNPRANLNDQLSKEENLSINYNGNSSSPSLQQLQPVPDLSNPYLVLVGNPNLKQQFDHNLDLSYNELNPDNFHSLLLSAGTTYTENKIAPSTVLSADGVQHIQYVNVNGVYSARANISYGMPLGDQKHGNGRFDSFFQYNHDVSFINDVEDRQVNLSYGSAVSVNYNYGDQFFLEARAGLNYTGIQYSVPGQSPNNLLSQVYSANVAYVFPASTKVSAEGHMQVNSKQGALPATTTSVVNVAVTKNVFGSHAGEVKVSCLDLLNAANSINQAAGPNYIQVTTNRTLNRLFQLSFLYNFKLVPKVVQKAI